MPLLLQIQGPVDCGGNFADGAGGIFVSDDGFKMEDFASTMRISTENFAGYRYWSGDILGIEPIAFRMDKPYGGMVRVSGAGNIEIAMDAFPATGMNRAGGWMPETAYPCQILYTDALEDSAVLLMTGTLFRNTINPPRSISFNFYPDVYDADLLSTAVDYMGATVPLPMAFGAVEYVEPVRLADSVTLVDGWQQRSFFPAASRGYPVAASVGLYVYAGMGGGYLKDWWKYSVLLDTWTPIADFGGTGRSEAVATALSTVIYSGLGRESAATFKKDWWKYDTATGAWTQLTDYSGVAVIRAVAVAANGKVYVGTGSDTTTPGSPYKKDWREYDPVGNSWASKTDFGGVARDGAVGVAVGTKIYVGLGYDSVSFYKDWWVYDTVANTWTAKTDFGGTARYGAVAGAVGTLIYVGTGIDVDGRKQDWWVYDTVANTWTAKANFGGAARSNAFGVICNDAMFVGLGFFESSPVNDFWRSKTTEVKQRFSAGRITSGFTVYDDGVDVTSNASAITNNEFTYNVSPVGTLTISGSNAGFGNTGIIFTELCGADWLNIPLEERIGTTVQVNYCYISRWQTQQIKAIDFLSEVAAATQCFFYVFNGSLYLYDMGATTPPTAEYDAETDALEGTVYEKLPPFSLVKYDWIRREAVEAPAWTVREIKESTVLSTYVSSELGEELMRPYGSESAVDTYSQTIFDIIHRLQRIADYTSCLRFVMNLPLTALSRFPGDKLLITDNRFDNSSLQSIADPYNAHVRDVVYDFIGKKITIEGEYSNIVET